MKQNKRPGVTPKQAARKVVQVLDTQGYQALLAGGCVRDMLLGKRPNDYDVATNATPETVTKLFPRTLTVGAQFGVVVVLIDRRQVEVATFRNDGEYHDGRRPSKVVFTDAREDALRRDFTINGMFYDLLNHRVIDYVGGRKDLKQGVVRAIGRPEERFAEDHLRMLRAVRFAARMGFRVETKTSRAIKENAGRIKRISAERIMAELERILTDPNRARGIDLAIRFNLLKYILPTMSDAEVRIGTATLKQIPANCTLSLGVAALLVACSADKSAEICRVLKSDNQLRKQVHWLVDKRARLIAAVPMSKGRLKQWLAKPLFEILMTLCQSFLLADKEDLSPLRQIRRQIKALGKEPIAPERFLDGHELIRLGATPGPMVGHLAEELYLAQLENEIGSKSQARKWASNWLAKHD
jgi:poly(A) polymerase